MYTPQMALHRSEVQTLMADLFGLSCSVALVVCGRSAQFVTIHFSSKEWIEVSNNRSVIEVSALRLLPLKRSKDVMGALLGVNSQSIL